MKRVVTARKGYHTVEFTPEDRMDIIKAFRGTFILDCDPRYEAVAEFVGLLEASK